MVFGIVAWMEKLASMCVREAIHVPIQHEHDGRAWPCLVELVTGGLPKPLLVHRDCAACCFLRYLR